MHLCAEVNNNVKETQGTVLIFPKMLPKKQLHIYESYIRNKFKRLGFLCFL